MTNTCPAPAPMFSTKMRRDFVGNVRFNLVERSCLGNIYDNPWIAIMIHKITLIDGLDAAAQFVAKRYRVGMFCAKFAAMQAEEYAILHWPTDA